MRHNIKHHFYLVILSIRDGFVSLVPYLVASSALMLIYALSVTFGIYPKDMPEWPVLTGLNTIFPLLVVASIAYHLGRVNGIEPSISMLLALSVYFGVNHASEVIGVNGFATINTILCPIISTSVLNYLLQLKILSPPRYSSLSKTIFTMYQYTPVFMIGLIVGVLIVTCIDMLEIQLKALFTSYVDVQNFSNYALLHLRAIFSPFLFFFGIHGPNVIDLTFGSQYLGQPIANNMNTKSFYDVFVIYGGSGACLGLAIAILLNRKDKHALNTTKVAMPFLVFNISEVLVYGLPVIFNRMLFIPFVFVPSINLMLAHWVVVDLGMFNFNEISVPWITPIFINAYLASDGNLLAVLFQALLLALDVLIYSYFVKKYISTQDSSERFLRLSNALNLTLAFDARQEVRFEKAQTHLIRSHKRTNAIVDMVTQNKLLMFYQPKIDVRSQQCNEFEALIRLEMKDGQLVSTDFLSDLETAGLGPVVDMWVCHQVASDLATWQQQGFFPNISVNIHPDTLEDKACIAKMKQLLPTAQVQLEFVEKAFIDSPEAKSNIESLSQHGFVVAIDDFGSGYSSLNHLNEMPAQLIKMDKKLIDNANTERGKKMYLHMVSMCKDLGYMTVAEGVETAKQLAVAMDAKIDFVQGWYFSKAMPFDEVKRYSEQFYHAPNNAL